jgi:hypothetical protein
MSIESLAGMFSQRSGADQSMGSSVMSAIVGFLAQKMLGEEEQAVCYPVLQVEVVMVVV